MYGNFIKPIGDFTISFLVLTFISPLIVLISLLLVIQNKGDFLFFQYRPITPLGQLIRKCSLDEVLQLINVLKGEMSIVGPRPLLMKYLFLYDAKQIKRHDVLPGITGWAQVNGRNHLTWNRKFELDLDYLDKRSFFLDAKILVRTFFIVLTRSGVNKEGLHPSTEFKGTSAC